VVFTSQLGNFDINKGGEQEGMTFSNYITAQECEDSESEVELAETPKTLKDGGKQQSMI